MSRRPAAGGGHWVDVPPERITRWLLGFGERHGGAVLTTVQADHLRYEALDGAVAELYPLLPVQSAEGLAEQVLRDRRIGVLLVRLGGYAAGIFEGATLVSSKVGSRQVHGRSAAGGWSQQRFARRRDKQSREAFEAAADVAVRILGDQRLDAVVLGGDRQAIDALRPDPRLAKVFALSVDRFLTVPDPRLAILKETPAAFRAVRIKIIEPA